VPPIARRGARDDDLVSLTGTDLVVTARTAVRLHSLVRLHVPHIEVLGIVIHQANYGTDS